MREIRPSGLEGGVALTRHPYPYRSQVERRIYAAEGVPEEICPAPV